MYVNTVRFRFKGLQDAEQGIERMRDVVAGVASMPGFLDLTVVRTTDAEALSIVRFETKADADLARERMLPRVRDAIASHLSGEPEVRPGDAAIELSRATQGARTSTTPRSPPA